MGYRPLRSALLGTIVVSAIACGEGVDPPRPPDPPDPPEPRDVAFVSPTGDDAAAGTRSAPFRTLERALSSDRAGVVLLEGVHSEGSFEVDRPVVVEGEGEAVIEGTLEIAAAEIRIRRLWVNGGLKAISAPDLSVETTTVTAGVEVNAVSLTGGSVRLERSTLECGTDSCLFARAATVGIDLCRLTGTATTKWGLRAEGGTITVRRAVVDGGRLAAMRIEGEADATVERSETRGGGNGLVVLGGSTLKAEEVVVSEAVKSSLLLQNSTADVLAGRYDGTSELTIGISGGRAVLSDVWIGSSGFGAVSISAFLGDGAEVRFEGGTVEHGAKSGILATGSDVLISRTRFLGDPESDGDDAVTASGAGTRVTVEGAVFDGPSGFAVGFYDDASGTISATVSRPRLGGVLVQGPRLEPVRIADSVITGCRQGSGVALQNSQGTTIDRVLVDGCSEAGVVGNGAEGAIENSALLDNLQFGVGAFGGAVLTVRGSTIAGSPFATFATCGDGARVDLLGQNRIEGSVTECP